MAALGLAGLLVLSPAMMGIRNLARAHVAYASIWAHLVVFAGLAAVMWWAWGRMWPGQVGLGLVGLAVLLEGVQGWMPGRAVEGIDLVANFGGLGIGLIVARMWLGPRQA